MPTPSQPCSLRGNPDQSQVPSRTPSCPPGDMDSRGQGEPGDKRSELAGDGMSECPLLFLSHQEDQKEGMAAFVEKRKANFKGQ